MEVFIQCKACSSWAEFLVLEEDTLTPLCRSCLEEYIRLEGETNLKFWSLDDESWIEEINKILTLKKP